MTAADIARVRPERRPLLPALAGNPAVDVYPTLTAPLGDCGICTLPVEAEHPAPGVMRVEWRSRLDIPPSGMDVCGEHANQQLGYLINHSNRVPTEIVLLAPAVWAVPGWRRSAA